MLRQFDYCNISCAKEVGEKNLAGHVGHKPSEQGKLQSSTLPQKGVVADQNSDGETLKLENFVLLLWVRQR